MDLFMWILAAVIIVWQEVYIAKLRRKNRKLTQTNLELRIAVGKLSCSYFALQAIQNSQKERIDKIEKTLGTEPTSQRV